MSVLTETIIEIADRHTILDPFQSKTHTEPLQIWSAKEYVALHRLLAERSAIAWPDADSAAVAGLKSLRPGYEDHKYWHRALSSAFVSSYPEMAWQELLPILGIPACRVECPAPAKAAYRISPVMRALIYPFGWSAWLSLRVTGAHSLQDLDNLVQSFFTANTLSMTPPGRTVSVKQAFTLVGAGIRDGVFGKAHDVDPQDVVIVTTVLAKHGGSPPLGGMSSADEASMLRLVRPVGPKLKSIEGHVYRVDPDASLEYIVYDDHGRFVWLEHLLDAVYLNHSHLRCYHNNTFRSFVHAWQLHGLLDVGLKIKKAPAAVAGLMSTAKRHLSAPTYRNASLHEYLLTRDVVGVLALAAKV